MTASPDTIAAFDAWKFAELASHYAAPCPDEVMNRLVDRTYELLGRMASAPVVNGDDLVLKLFPFFLAYFEPRLGDDPMLPHFGDGDGGDEKCALFESILDDFRRLFPPIAEAMAAPNKDRKGPRA